MNIIFDLDGTISDSSSGIINSINYALNKMKYKCISFNQGRSYIGPSLKVIFSQILNTNDESLINNAITLYRERYFSIGYKENKLYKDVDKLIIYMHKQKHRLYIATNKQKEIADKILIMFNMKKYFINIYGADLNNTKSNIIKELLFDYKIDKNITIMIGDREEDIISAHNNEIRAILVKWGYATESEIINSKYDYIVNDPDGIYEIIK
ncbi:MAG: HAD hydrolase-like protein [Spirochaetota bacterium]